MKTLLVKEYLSEFKLATTEHRGKDIANVLNNLKLTTEQMLKLWTTGMVNIQDGKVQLLTKLN